jgi:HK97 family phage prohead protease
LTGRRNSGRNLSHLASRVFGVPLMIHPSKADVILSVLGPRLGIAPGSIPAVLTRPVDADDFDGDELEYSAQNGVAVIPVFGTLVKRASGMDADSGLTSYEELTSQIKAAMADPDVQGLVLDCDSPGGESSGLFDLCDMIYSLRGAKPMFACANDSAFSAAYAVASSADKVFTSRTGGVGSIGVFMLHVDQSAMDRQEGLKFEYIFAGEGKTAGNVHEPLDKDARAELQGEVDRQRAMFVDLVARNRQRSTDEVLDLQARCLYGPAATPLLADEVGGVDDAVDELMDMLESVSPRSRRFLPSRSPAGRIERSGQSQNELPRLYSAATGAGKPGWADQTFSAEQSFALTGHKQPVTLAVRVSGGMRASVPNSGSRRISLLCAPYDGSADFGSHKEVYAPGCFSRGLDGDLRALFAHDERYVLGRVSAGNCKFWEDARGVHVDIDPEENYWTDALLGDIRVGNINQSSCAFYILADKWEMRGSERFRVIERARMREASVVSFAAYDATEATAGGQHALPAAASHAETDLARCQRELAAFAPQSDLEKSRLELLRLR